MLLGLSMAGTAMFGPDLHAGWRDELLTRFHGVILECQQLEQVAFDTAHGPSKAWVQQFRADLPMPELKDWSV